MSYKFEKVGLLNLLVRTDDFQRQTAFGLGTVPQARLQVICDEL